MTTHFRLVPVLALAFFLVAPSGADAQTWTSPLGKVYPIPGFALGIFDRIPDAHKEIFLKATSERQARYLELKAMEVSRPQEWQALQQRVDAQARASNLSSRPEVSAEIVLERGENIHGTVFVKDGAPVVWINPAIVGNPVLLELTLVHEDVHHKQRLAEPPPQGLSAEAKLRYDAKLEIAAHVRELRVALERGFNGEIKRIRDALQNQRSIAGAGHPDQVFIFGRGMGVPATLAELKAWAATEADTMKLETDVDEVASGVKDWQFRLLIDPATGNIAFADESDFESGGERMEHADLARAMGVPIGEAISGFVRVRKLFDASGKQTGVELLLDFTHFPKTAEVRSPAFWRRALLALASHPEAHVLSGAILVLQGTHRVLEDTSMGPEWWWRFEGGDKVLASMDPPEKVKAEPAPENHDPFFPRTEGTAAPETGNEHPIGTLAEEPSPLPDPEAVPEPAPAEQGPADPPLEQKIHAFLKDTTIASLEQAIASGDFKAILKSDLFRAGDRKERIRTWKKALTNPAYAGPGGHNELLARLRLELVVSIWEQIAAENGLKIELLDSGKLNGYRSDLDLTTYTPLEGRGTLTVAGLMDVFEERFKIATDGLLPADLDITPHDGDFFIPDPRRNAQSFEAYGKSLHTVVAELRGNMKNGRDAFVDPDANRRQVQRRALREGRVITLVPVVERTKPGDGTTPTKYRIVRQAPRPVSELTWHPGGGWDVNADRLDNIRPNYDRSDQFGNLLENLDHMIRNGDNPPDFAKDFMRAINEGVGSGMVNSYSDIHGSDMPDKASAPGMDAVEPSIHLAPGEEVVRLALELESGITVDRQRANLGTVPIGEGKTAQTKTMAKLRWIIRAFGLAKSSSPIYTGSGKNVRLKLPPKPQYTATEVFHLQKLFQLVNVAADMARLKNRGEFKMTHGNPNTGRSSWLYPYFEMAESRVRNKPEFQPKGDGRDTFQGDAFFDAVYDEAWRLYTFEVKQTVVEAMTVAVTRLLTDLTPEGMRRNAMQFATADGKVNLLAARKLALQRREQLAQLFELIETLTKEGDYQGADANQQARARDGKRVAEQLRETVRKKIPSEMADQVERLMDLSEAEFDNFLDEIAPSAQDIETILAAKKGRLDAINEPAENVSAEKLRKHIRDALKRKAAPRDGPMIEKVLEGLDALIEKGLGPEDFMAQVSGNFTGVMVGNSLTNIAMAAQSGDDRAFREAVLTEAFNLFLPPGYGVAATLLKDYGRGNFAAGTVAVGSLALFHGVETIGTAAGIPGLGQAYLVFQLAKNIPHLAYIVLSQEMADDIMEQALMSRPSTKPAGGLRLPGAERNPYRFSLAGLKEGMSDADKAEYERLLKSGDLKTLGHKLTQKIFTLPSLPAPIKATLQEAAKTDTPLGPLLFNYNQCGDPADAGWPPHRNPVTGALEPLTMVAEDQGTPFQAMLPKARQIFGPGIWRELIEANLTPDKIEQSTNKEFSAAFAAYARDQFEKMYAFDLPYYQRISRIYECFYPKLKAKLKKRGASAADRMSFGGDAEDFELEVIFTEVVDNWFGAQPDGYKDQWGYTSMLQHLAPWHDAEGQKQRFRKGLVLRLMGLYKSYEAAALYKADADKNIREQAIRNSQRLQAEERRAFGKRTSLVTRLGAAMDGLMSKNAVKDPPRPSAWLQVPAYFIPLQPEAIKPTSQNPATQTREAAPRVARESSPSAAASQGAREATDIIANIRADRTRYPLPWSAEYKVTLESVSQDWQAVLPGLKLSAEERASLTRVGPDGKSDLTVLAVKLMASADIFDARGQKFTSAPAVPVLGYMIDRVPRFAGTLTVNVKAKRKQKDGKVTAEYVPAKVTIGPQVLPTQAAAGAPDGQAVFTNMAAAEYQIVVTPESADFGPATATAKLANPKADAMVPGADDVEASLEVSVELPFIGKTEEEKKADDPAKPTDPGPDKPKAVEPGKPDPTKTAAGKPDPTKTTTAGGKKPTDPVNPGGPADPTKQATNQGNPTDPKNPTDPTGAGNQGPIRPPQPPPIDPNVVQGAIGGVTGASAQCEYEAALRNALQMQQQMGSVPAVQVWLAANLGDIQAKATAQRRARIALTLGQSALRSGDFDGGIAGAVIARGEAPTCMYPAIDALIEELINGKVRTLVNQEEQAEGECNYESAANTVAAITGLPRTGLSSQWLGANQGRVLDLKTRQSKVRTLVADAKKIGRSGGAVSGFNARTAADWQAVQAKLAEATAVPPPDCEEIPSTPGTDGTGATGDKPTDDVPAGLSGTERTPANPPGAGGGTTAGGGGGGAAGPRGGTQPGNTGGGGTGAGGGAGPGGTGGAGGTGAGGGAGGDLFGGGSDACTACVQNRCASVCGKAVIMLCTVQSASDACQQCASGCNGTTPPPPFRAPAPAPAPAPAAPASETSWAGNWGMTWPDGTPEANFQFREATLDEFRASPAIKDFNRYCSTGSVFYTGQIIVPKGSPQAEYKHGIPERYLWEPDPDGVQRGPLVGCSPPLQSGEKEAQLMIGYTKGPQKPENIRQNGSYVFRRSNTGEFYMVINSQGQKMIGHRR